MNSDEVLRQLAAGQAETRQMLMQLLGQAQVQTRLDQERFFRELLALPRYQEPNRLNRHESKVFSQHGEDGIIAEIFRRIGATDRRFVEVGVGNGLECNSTYLLWRGWKGLWMDGDAHSLQAAALEFRSAINSGGLTIVHAIVSGQNIAELFARYEIAHELDFLSLDIDRNTWFLWKALAKWKPRAVCVEYNASIPPADEFCVTDDADGLWNGTLYFGASLKSYEILGKELGYTLVGCETAGANAFFVRDDLVNDRFTAPFTSENHHEPPRYFLDRLSGHPPRFGEAVASRRVQRK